MKKKLLSLFVALAMCITLIVGCNKSDDNKKPSDDDNESEVPTTTPVQLTAPTITLTDNVISWAAVENASGYDVYEGETVVSTAQTQLKYTIEKTESGSWTYTVVAVSNDTTKYTNSKPSNSKTYTYTKPVDRPEEKPTVDTSTKLTGNIYVVGDSTVCSFTDPYYIPRYGYGTQLYNYINCDQTQIKNLALSGRSSVDFVTESNYTTLKNSISTGDYLIIGFGHNDQKADIYSNPNGDKDTAGSFQNSLYTNYVKMATDKGATPILCTPIVRLNPKNDYSGSSGHIVDQVAEGKPGGDYAKAIRDLGEATETTVVDLTAITKEDYTALGYEKASDYHCWTVKKNGERDGLDQTHTNLYGAKMNAYHIANAILQSDCSLKANVRTNLTKPDHDTEYAASINTKYVEVDYASPDLSKRSAIWTTVTAEGWYGSAFGEMSKQENISASNFTIKQNSDTSFTIGNGTSSVKGKIASSGDGIACVFKQLDPNQNFTLTAEVTLDSVGDGAKKQAAFGIMFRDEMLVDKYDPSVKGNSAIAGGYTGSSEGATCVYNYQRLNGDIDVTASKQGTGTNFATDDTFTIEMVKSDRTITCKVTKGSQTYISKYTDVTYTGVDTSYTYLCLFATRGIVATFTNVNYVANGISAGA